MDGIYSGNERELIIKELKKNSPIFIRENQEKYEIYEIYVLILLMIFIVLSTIGIANSYLHFIG